jgi:hypothetical protein
MQRLKPLMLPAVAALLLAGPAQAQIAASHVYHNHMPNFWPYYDVSKYASTPVGGAIRYTYDAQVINLKKNPPSNYTYYLPSGAPMPHDDLVTYYSHDAKTGASLYWPPDVAADMNTNASTGQVHVTMSGAVVNNVNDLNALQNVPGYTNTNWGAPWRDRYNTLRTPGGNRTTSSRISSTRAPRSRSPISWGATSSPPRASSPRSWASPSASSPRSRSWASSGPSSVTTTSRARSRTTPS